MHGATTLRNKAMSTRALLGREGWLVSLGFMNAG
jgi:hypothetical protein